jgi:hypothetical protein
VFRSCVVFEVGKILFETQGAIPYTLVIKKQLLINSTGIFGYVVRRHLGELEGKTHRFGKFLLCAHFRIPLGS